MTATYDKGFVFGAIKDFTPEIELAWWAWVCARHSPAVYDVLYSTFMSLIRLDTMEFGPGGQGEFVIYLAQEAFDLAVSYELSPSAVRAALEIKQRIGAKYGSR